MNLCTACGKDFGGVAAFDAHRVGVHAYTFTEGMALDPPRENGRRCLDDEELAAKGFVQNAHGRWTTAASIERGRALNPEALA